MSGRRGGNRIRGPQSALTDFLAANNISAAQIRDDYERRRQQAGRDTAAGEGSSHQNDNQDDDVALAAAAQAEEEEKAKTKKRKHSEKDAIDRIKNAKKTRKSKGKKTDPDSEGNYEDDDDEFGMYKMAKPLPGQLEHCESCGKRFTVTPYSKEGPEGGLLCTPCGKALKKDLAKEQRAACKPAGRKRRKVESDRLDGITSSGAKSLVQLCIQKIAKHHEDIEELGDLPQPLLERLGEIFSKKRILKPKTLPLFLRPDLDSVQVHDAAYLESDDYQQIFAVTPNITKLVLGNACQMKDRTMEYMLERCHNLKHLQLYAANLISDALWHRLFCEAGKGLETVKLKWLDAAFDDTSVCDMVKSCPNLERLKLKLCRKLSEKTLDYISQLSRLKHLSLQINADVSKSTLIRLIEKRGQELQTLSLEKFLDADDAVLQAINANCSHLSKLRFSENDTATDVGYTNLFTDWHNPPLTFVDFNFTRDVDNNNPKGPEDPVGLASNGFQALIAHSGQSLKYLDVTSCRHIEHSTFLDVFNGEKNYPALEHINVSFCNSIDTNVIIGIFKSCPSLKRLVAFGCFDIQEVIVPRNIALIGVPRAQDAIEQFGVGIDVDEAIGRMVEVAA